MQCGELYNNKYVRKEKALEVFNEAFVIGRYVHSVLEMVLDPKTEVTNSQEAFVLILPQLIKEYGLEEISEDDILKVASELGELLYKASSRYCGKDAIRNKDGSVPNNVKEYPPQAWTSALKNCGVSSNRYALDNMAASCNGVFTEVSLSYLVADIYSYVVNFKSPDWAETIAVEVGFSTDNTNRVLFPGAKELSVNGYIDWIIKIKENDALIILDHKTESTKPLAHDVMHHAQLNIYAKIYAEHYGKLPDGIGIHHVPSGEIVLAEVDPTVQNQIVEYFQLIQHSIEAGLFTKRHPKDFNSPCAKFDYKSGKLKSICPYLHKCWPTYVECLTAAGEL
jgi:hypothetical protein